MENDPDFKLTAEKLKNLGQKQMTKEERKKRQRALDDLGVPNFVQFWKQKVEESTGMDVEIRNFYLLLIHFVQTLSEIH